MVRLRAFDLAGAAMSFRQDTLTSGRSRCHGLNLIELVVGLALLGILLGLAVPAYQAYAQRGYRVGAIERMLEAARCQERLRVRRFHYDTTACATTDPNGRYRLRYEPADAAETPTWRIIAIPQGAQATEGCGSLALDHTGRRTADGGRTTRECWGGR